jgi:hypothetical protein
VVGTDVQLLDRLTDNQMANSLAANQTVGPQWTTDARTDNERTDACTANWDTNLLTDERRANRGTDRLANERRANRGTDRGTDRLANLRADNTRSKLRANGDTDTQTIWTVLCR